MNETLLPDPLLQFQLWFSKAKGLNLLKYPHAMTVSTVDEAGWPDSRILLLKEVDSRGFVFFTNFNSIKGRSLAQNPRSSLLFYWEPLGYQVRIQGKTEKVTESESDAYFDLRPRLSQIGAWASQQSEVLPEREVFETEVERLEQLYHGKKVPRPPHWGGYRVIPHKMEFWIERPFRWHDRFEYQRNHETDQWEMRRLYP